MLSEQIQSAFRNFLKPILRVRPVASASSSDSTTSKSSDGLSADPKALSHPRPTDQQSQSHQEDSGRSDHQLASQDSAHTSNVEPPAGNNGPPLWSGPAPDPGSRSAEVTDGMSLIRLSEALQDSHHQLSLNRGKAQYKEKSLTLGKPRRAKKGIIVDQKAG